MAKKKAKTDLINELIQLKQEIANLEKKNELIWEMYLTTLDELADIRMQQELRFESEYEYILSGESGLTEEEEKIYLESNYEKYKAIKKGLTDEQRLLSDVSVPEDYGRTEEEKEEAERV